MSTPTMITVQGTFLKSDGTPEKGSLEFYNSNYVLQSGGITTVVPSMIRATLDSQGFISVTIPATDDPDWRPSGWTYTLVFKLSGDYSTINVSIPYDSPGGILPITKLVPAINVPVVSGPHTHDASDIVSGTLSIARLPVGTSHAQVAFGDHNHDDRYFTEAEITTALAGKTDTSDLAPVALSGSYNDLTDKPTGGSGAVTSVAGKTGDVTLNKADIGLSNVDNTSDANKPVSTATATALSNKANTTHTHAQSDITGLTTALSGKANTSSLATVATSGSYTDLTNKPTIPTVPVTSVAGKTGDVVLTKSDVSLSNVDNTSDANKPISSAIQTALDSKVNKSDYPGLLVLATGAPVPGGTPANTVIVRY